jgi:hypothetical protein
MIRGLVLALLTALSLPDLANAQTRGLEGLWSGGGPVIFPSGAREQARCRVRYTRVSDISYVANATCATASGRASQTAVLRRASQNSYRGRFHKSEYNISGLILVVLRGNSQSVRLTSGNGSAFIQLRR